MVLFVSEEKPEEPQCLLVFQVEDELVGLPCFPELSRGSKQLGIPKPIGLARIILS
jgi:hypothetical protein